MTGFLPSPLLLEAVGYCGDEPDCLGWPGAPSGSERARSKQQLRWMEGAWMWPAANFSARFQQESHWQRDVYSMATVRATVGGIGLPIWQEARSTTVAPCCSPQCRSVRALPRPVW